jgi:hypothetical protein
MNKTQKYLIEHSPINSTGALKMNIRLIAINGKLYFPFGGYDSELNPDANSPSMLMRRYSAGDCDTCPWPMVSEYATPAELRTRLACALFDEREMNDHFPDSAIIELPDGSIFDFDQYVD